MNTVKARIVLAVMVVLTLVAVSAGGEGVSKDRQAFEEALTALVRFYLTGIEGDSEIHWASGLKQLALSQSAEADVLLVQLALLKTDGAYGEEYGCAAAKRGGRFSVLLEDALREFDRVNSCAAFATEMQVHRAQLCKTKEEFSRLVKRFPPDRDRRDTESGCTY
jgi:hypothetical protein